MSTRCMPFLAILTLGSLITVGCNDTSKGGTADDDPPNTPADTAKTPYKIVTTCGMVTDIVRTIAGDRGTVEGLMGERVDPHMYKPTRNDQKKLLRADIIFYSGLMLEGRMSDTFTRAGRGGKPVYAVTEKIGHDYLREPPEFQGHWDPHVWMDITAWSQCVDVVTAALSDFDPSHATAYKSRSQEYQAQLREMDEYVRKTIATIPRDRRWLITAHDAFGYFSRAYDIPVRSVQGISTESEAAVDDINELVSFIVENEITAIFVESSVNPKNIQAIIEGCKQKQWGVRIGGELFTDAMGPPGTYTGTYLGMMDHNATIIARALGGEAPETGKHGKLQSHVAKE